MSTQNNTEMSGQRRRRLNQPYEPRQRSRTVVPGTESVPAEMLNNSDRVHNDIPDITNTTGCYYNLPVLEFPTPPQPAQTASEPALGSSGSHCYITGPYYYPRPTQSAIIAPQGNYWPPLAGTGSEDGLGMSSVLQFPNPLAGFAGIVSQQNSISDSDPWSVLIGRSPMRQWSDSPFAGSSHWIRTSSTSQFQNQPQPTYDQFMCSNIGNHAQLAGDGADIPVNANNYSRGTLSFNPVCNTDFYSTVQFQNSIRQGFPPTNAVALPPQISLRTESIDANMAEDARAPVKRRPGRPCKSSSTNNEDNKRPDKSTIEVNMLQIQIGQWQRTCEPGRATDLSAKCYSKQCKLLWVIYCLEKKLKDRIVMKWKSIEAMEAIPRLFQLKLKLSEPPSFSEEVLGNPKVHSLWKRVNDFTKGEALRDRVVHTLMFNRESYETYINFLMKFEPLRDLLNVGMRVAVAVAPRAEAIVNNHVPCHHDGFVQVNEAGPSSGFMELAVFNGGRVNNEASGMGLLMSESWETESLLPEIGNAEDVLPEVPSTSHRHV